MLIPDWLRSIVRRSTREHRKRILDRSRHDLILQVARQQDLRASVEWLEDRTLLAFDFGDAPAPYPTTLAEDGAHHEDVGPTLGTTRDSEADGTHSAAGDADGADEDGVVFGVVQVGALDATVTVNVQGGPAKLDAWIDFNGDGNWGGPGEQIFDTVDVIAGDNVLTFDVPSTASGGFRFSRFRLSTAGNLGVGGFAADGETEDYVLAIESPSEGAGALGYRTSISTNANSAESVVAADVDGDGDMDVLSASSGDDKVAWYENDGGSFTERVISTTADGAVSVVAADLDGDGDIDVLSASVFGDKIAWYENNGTQVFMEHTISIGADGANDVLAADIDGDGDMDVLASSGNDDKVAWYENDGSQTFTERIITTDADAVRAVFAADLDNDGDLDVLSASWLDSKLSWYENDGSGVFTERVITTDGERPRSVVAADVDNDGDLDVIAGASLGGAIAWYENDGAAGFTRRVVGSTIISVESIVAADLDGDGDIDLLAAGSNNTIAWYENDGLAWFTENLISVEANGVDSVFASDMDGDGDPDVLSAFGSTVGWYEQYDRIVALSVDQSVIDEMNGVAIVTASISRVSNDATVIDLVRSGTAIETADYAASSDQIIIPAGSLSASVTISALPDVLEDDNESVIVEVLQVSNATEFTPQQVTVSIRERTLLDYGDAPFPYPVLDSENGAAHGITGPRLGLLRDADLPGSHSVHADFDDLDGQSEDDEDGVSFGELHVGSNSATVTVDVQVAAGKLDAWIDFDGDGHWGGPGEHIFDSKDVIVGENVLIYAVPATAVSGQTYARFRLSTAGNLGIGGHAADGEVEDYVVSILASRPENVAFGDGVAFTPRFASSAFAADIDRDGDIDLVSAVSDTVYWHENVGSQVFMEHLVSTVDRAKSVSADDVDGDGDTDLIAVSQDDDRILWFENDGAQGFAEHVITTGADSVRSVVSADVDGDGDLDILSASYSDDTIAWYENDNQTFTKHVISVNADGAFGVATADIDGDGDMDVLSASTADDKVAWYENDGNQTFTERIITTGANSAQAVLAADVDSDGDMDVISASSNDRTIAWYNNNGNQEFTNQLISTNFNYSGGNLDAARSILGADIDEDGDLDVLAASMLDGTVVWHRNDGRQNFTAHLITDDASSVRSVFASDIDGDGDLDAGSSSVNGVEWFSQYVPTVELTTDVSVIPEHGGVANITAIASSIGSAPITVRLEVSGTTTAGDFLLSATEIEIPAGSETGTATITAVSDLPIEGVETVVVDVVDIASAHPVGSQQVTVTIADNVDFGDAPGPYPVTISDQGPFHILAGPSLGSRRDSEPFGSHSANADEDDVNGTSDDEDGVAFGTIQVGALDAIVTVNIQGGSGKLNGWIDFNGDGSWSGPEEHVFNNVEVLPGDQTLFFDVPATAVPGKTYARFRLSTAGVKTVRGTATDGEVEDYEVTITRSGETTAFVSQKHIISAASDEIRHVIGADLDGDGDLDVAGITGTDIEWFENDGNAAFTAHTVSTSARFLQSLFSADIDGDGDPDLVSASPHDDVLAWYENDAHQTFAEHLIETRLQSPDRVFPADLDDDGDIDLLTGRWSDSRITWHENDGSGVFTEHTLTVEPGGGGVGLLASDIDNDGDLDVVAASNVNDTIRWYRNDGNQIFTAHVISTTVDNPKSLSAIDIDGDGDTDILSASYSDDKIAWHENDGHQSFTERVLSSVVVRPLKVSAADFDGDGDLDVLAAARGGITWYENDGSASFMERTRTTEPRHLTSIYPGDVDGDGDLDVLSAFISDDTIAWHERVRDLDFGDAPNPYPTSGDSGAAHEVTGPRLGLNRDSERTGIPTVDADSDDLNGTGPNDEDGVIFGDISVGALDAVINVNVQEASGRINAWVDFNGDGNWGGPGEQILANANANIGANLFTYDVPASAVPGTTFARIRLSSAGSLGPAGIAGDGEIEDYRITILPAKGSGAFGAADEITNAGSQIRAVDSTDLDDDGDIDLLMVDSSTDTLVWYSNEDNAGFSAPAVLASIDSPDEVLSADIDRDGDTDILVAGGSLTWYENDGNQAFAAHQISSQGFSAFPADIDGDGDIDIVATLFVSGEERIAWYKNDGNQEFVLRVIGETENPIHSVFAADMDGDGDMDLLSSSHSSSKFVWYENDGDQTFVQRSINPHGIAISAVSASDIDDDGDLDILSASWSGSTVAWYENNGNGSFTRRLISDTADSVVHLYSTDIDGDGDIDVLGASYGDEDIVWHQNDGGGVFTERALSTASLPFSSGVRHVHAADLDGDGDLEPIVVRRDSISSFEQLSPTVTLNAGSMVAVEGGAPVTVTATASFASVRDVIVNLSTGGTVSAEDFGVSSNRILIPAGHTTGTVTIAAAGDSIAEPAESLIVEVASVIDGLEGGSQQVSLTVVDDADFGDAPQPYPVTESELGPLHVPVGPTLGAIRDGESHGTHSFNADFDDEDGVTDDEDGVTFGVIQVGAAEAILDVNIQGGAGLLDAWIDFNGDGSWGGPGEQILDSRPVSNGETNFEYAVPAFARPGTTYARVRLSTIGNLGIGGAAVDGEVEDYEVIIAPSAPNVGDLSGKTISTLADGAARVFAADIDGDGDTDILNASTHDDTIAWYQNDGGSFTRRVITATASGAYDVFAADVDGDGDIDVLGASRYDHTIAWYENDGAQSFAKHVVSEDSTGAQSVFAADIDGDGDIDIISASGEDDTVAWFENDGNELFARHIVSSTVDGAASVFAADVDNDGDIDILSASANDHTITWYENTGARFSVAHTISSDALEARSVFAADVDGDGDTDVLSASAGDNTVAWYENDGNEFFTKRVLSSHADGARGVFAADQDGDGDIDVLTASSDDGRISLYRNEGAGVFTELAVAGDSPGHIFAADVDADGDLDAVVASQLENAITWFDTFGALDFGDAPFPFPVTELENGAAHVVVGPQLGSNRDAEHTGSHTADANSDDVNGTADDEDGVGFGVIRVGAIDATVTVNVQNADGRLDAWIDFNGDGNWGGFGEQIFDAVDVPIGDHSLTFDVPAAAVSGTTYARFRLSTAGDVGVSGIAPDGEVEDYQVTIVPPVPTVGVFATHRITTSSTGTAGLFAADLDQDGDVDIIRGDRERLVLAWYENTGSGVFTERSIHQLAAPSAFSEDVVVVDIDGDGDMDVVTNHGRSGVRIYENDGSQNFVHYTRFMDVSVLHPADVNGDGDVDILITRSNFASFLENEGSPSFTQHSVGATGHDDSAVYAADIDFDGDLDVVTAARYSDRISWHENNGDETFTTHIVTQRSLGAEDILAIDINGDGHTDLVSASASDDKVVWHPNSGSQSFGGQTVSSTADGAFRVLAADIDGDGDVDILSASANDNKIAWYENDGNENFGEHVISIAVPDLEEVALADIDSDGDLDVVAGGSDAAFYWFENVDENDPPPVLSIADVTVDEDAVLASATLSLSQPTFQDVAVTVTTADSTASAGDDYVAHSAVVTIPAGQLTATFDVTILFDAIAEADEDFVLNLSSVAGAVVGDSEGVVTIVNQEPGMLAISPAFVSLPEGGAGGPRGIQLRWRQVQSSGGTFDVWGLDNVSVSGTSFTDDFDPGIDGQHWLDTSNGIVSTAFSGSSGTALLMTGNNPRTARTVNFTAVTGATIEFDLIFGTSSNGGENADAGEDVVLEMSPDSGATWSLINTYDTEDFTAWTTIQEQVPEVPDSQLPFEFTVTRTGSSAAETTVDYAVNTSGAADRFDFGGALPAGTLTFAEGQKTATLTIPVSGDTEPEPDESFTVLLSNPSGLTTIAVGSAAGTIENDDGPLGWDFGDAASPYPTALTQDGARHFLTGPRLGSARDVELDGVASSASDSDGIDDDGVTFSPIQVSVLHAEVVVNVQQGSGKLDAWIDFDLDGSWDDQGEQIFDSVQLMPGDNTLTYAVPDSATAGTTVARFRLSTVGDLDVTGEAADGEVEDYQVTIHPFPLVSISDLTVSENVGIARATLSLSEATFRDVVVTVTTSDLTAIAGPDYTSVSGLATIPAGQLTATFDFAVRNDTIAESPESLLLTLSAPQGATVDDGTAEVIITDDEPPTLAISPSSIIRSEGNPGDAAAEFEYTVFRTGNLSGITNVDVAVAGSGPSPAGGDDFGGVLPVGTLTFSVGQQAATFTATTTPDLNAEADEEFTVTLLNPSGLAVVSVATAGGTIENDDMEDFGDAPWPYPTASANGGARHVSVGPLLGSARDTELDGIPSAAADSDGADEDGVTFQPIQIGALQVGVTVFVQGGPARLYAWIDFDGDGNWGGPHEQIFDGVDVNIGNNSLMFDVPASASSGTTYARFRLSTAGDLGIAGAAADGEVEDYQIAIIPPYATVGAFAVNALGIQHDADALAEVDMDGDGDMDIVGYHSFGFPGLLVWYENDGTQNFTQHTIAATGGGLLSSFADSLFAADIDADEDIDIAFGTRSSLQWYENDGDQSFTQHTVSTPFSPRMPMFDLDGDGDYDFLATPDDDNEWGQLAWYENAEGNFVERSISTSADITQHVTAVDVDSDGDLDILSSSLEDQSIVWHENEGDQSFVERIFATNVGGAHPLRGIDIDRDGDIDVLSFSSWYENDGSQNFTARSTGVTSASLLTPIVSADVDGDGDEDILSTIAASSTYVHWHVNDGRGGFTVREIYTGIFETSALAVSDIDSDGDLDVLVGGSAGLSVWLENVDENDPLPGISIDNLSVGEDAGIASATISLSKVTFQDVTATVSTVDSTATATVDYVAKSAEVTIPAGEVSATFDVTILFDSVAEADETFLLNLSAATGATINDGEGVVTITDVAPNILTISPASIARPEGDPSGGSALQLRWRQLSHSNGSFDVWGLDNVSVSGTAFSDRFDSGINSSLWASTAEATVSSTFTGTSGNALLMTGTTERIARTLELSPPGNAMIQFDLIFGNGSNGGENADPSEDVVLEVSVDGGTSWSLVNTYDTEEFVSWTTIRETLPEIPGLSTHFEYMVTRSGSTTAPISVDYMVDGAVDRFDFGGTLPSGTVNFASGVRTVPLRVVASTDTVPEFDEPFTVALSNPTGLATIATGTAFGLIENDDGVVSGDFGDAPAPYPTMLLADGARHILVGPALGVTRDAESDGVPSAAADADGNDEDGVTFTPLQVGAAQTEVTVNVHGGPAKLDAWIDFDGNGSWADSGEQIFDSVDVVVGDNVLTFDVPSSAIVGSTFARFRLSTAGNLTVNGQASDGEVEDYQVDIHPMPTVSISDLSVSEGVGTAAATVTLSETTFQNVTVNVETSDLTAVAGEDYTATSTVVTIPAGQLTADFDVAIVDDNIAEFPEDIALTLSSPVGAEIDRGTATLIIKDNEAPELSIGPSSISLPEGDPGDTVTNFEYAVTRRGDLSVSTDVDFVVAGTGSNPANGNDFGGTLPVGTLVFGVDQQSAVFTIAVTPDLSLELDELFEVRLQNPSGAATMSTSTATGTIQNDDETADLGDAPAPYPTTLVNDGARHVPTGPQLGASRDAEADGIPSAAADADGDDEDGVTFGPLQVGIALTEVTVNVQGGAAKLDAWIDFNANGSWSDSGEQIFDSLDVAAGDNVLTFDVPSTAVVGSTFARFRLSTAGNLDFKGESSDGEVEDYQVLIATPPTISISDLSVDENVGTATAAITLSEESFRDVTVTVTTSDSTATAGEDYAATSAVVTIFAGQLTAGFDIPILDDGLIELSEDVILTLSSADGADIDRGTARLTIQNDDTANEFGDAPAPYPTSLADNGARHAPTGPQLGASRDAETDGVPSAASDSDGLDDDGVFFGAIHIGALQASVTVTVEGGPARLDAWIDFNGDGNWGGPSEQIFDNVPVDSGDNPLKYDVSPFALPGFTTARFRLSTAGDLGIGGVAQDGEVEDYRVQILPPSRANGLFGPANVIGNEGTDDFAVDAADIDGDGDMDIITGKLGVFWYENTDGNGTFGQQQTIASSDTLSVVRQVFAMDADGDGDTDVIAATSNGQISLLANDGTGTFVSTVTANETTLVASVFPADMDEDGDIDVAYTLRNDKVAWLENNRDGTFTVHTIANESARTSGVSGTVFVADLDRDGDMDVLRGEPSAKIIEWYDNDGVANFTRRVVDDNALGVADTVALDLDGDGDTDIVSSTGPDLRWYENDGLESFSVRVISDQVHSGRDLFVTDIDGDGSLDVLHASVGTNAVAWHRNDGNENFSRQVITTTADRPLRILAADINGDGDMDAITTSFNDDTIAWYENLPPADLRTVAFDALSDHVVAGRTDVTFTIQNVGTGPAGGFDAHVVWSPDGVVGNDDDLVVAGSAVSFSGLEAGESLNHSLPIQLDKAALYAHAMATTPAGQPVGTVSVEAGHLFLVVDGVNTVYESDETNNFGRGHQIDGDDVTYFPWDVDGNGVVTPREALAAIGAITSDDPQHDFDGNGMVTPLEALAVLQRLGYRRNESVVEIVEFLTGRSPGHVIAAAKTRLPSTLPVAAFRQDEERLSVFAAIDDDFEPERSLRETTEVSFVDEQFSSEVDWLSVI